MRYSEWNPQILEESYATTIANAVKNVVKKPIKTVTNTTTALQVIARVISNPDICETVCFLMRKEIVRYLNTMPKTIKERLWNVVPRGYQVVDFLTMLILLPAVGLLSRHLKGIVGENISENILGMVSRLVNVKSLATGVMSMGAAGIFGAISSLGIADQLLFRTLSQINEKIRNTT